MLTVEISQTVERSFLGVFFWENSPVALLEWNIETFNVFILFPLLSLIDYCTIFENGLNGVKLFGGIFYQTSPAAARKRNFENFLRFHVFALSS
jgi:hypothetical protein